MELCMHKKAVFILPLNILTVWSPAFLATQHTTVCLDTCFCLCLAIHVSSTHYPTKASPIVWFCLIMGVFRNSILHADCKIITVKLVLFVVIVTH